MEPNQILSQPVNDDAITIVVNELVELATNPIDTVLNQTFFNHRNKTGRNIDESQEAFDELRSRALFGDKDQDFSARAAGGGDVCILKQTEFVAYVSCAYTNILNLDWKAHLPLYITVVLAILVLLKFFKTTPIITKKAAQVLPIKVDKNFTGVLCWRIQLFDANNGKELKKFPPEGVLGIDFYVIGSRGSISSKFEIHEKCSYLLHDNNFELIQADDFIGDVEAVEVRVTATMQFNLKISNIAIRSVLTREPETYVFLPEDEEECKFECLGEWDGFTIAAMIEDFHIMKFLRNDPRAAQGGPKHVTDHAGFNNLVKEFMLFGNGVAGSYLSHSLRSLLLFNSFVGCQHAYITWMLYGGSMTAGAAMPAALSFFIKFIEFMGRNSYSILIAKSGPKKVLDDDYDDYGPYASGGAEYSDEDENSEEPDKPEIAALKSSPKKPKGKLKLNDEDDEDLEIEKEWRLKGHYKGTSLELLPLRAQLLLKEDGWTEHNILSTWPNGATPKLVAGLEETGVKIGFNSSENRVSIKKQLPKWWSTLPLELRAKMIDFGWDFTKIAYYRPMRIPKHLISLSEQYGYRLQDGPEGLVVSQTPPEWFGTLPEGLQDALIASEWTPERILAQKLTQMPSTLLSCINSYGIKVSFDQDGLVTTQSSVPLWWEKLPVPIKDWSVSHAMNFRLLSATKIELLKYGAENWDNTERLKDWPIQLRDELEQWSSFHNLLGGHLGTMIAAEKLEAEKDEIMALDGYPSDPNMPSYVKYTDPIWWKQIPIEIRRKLIKHKISAEYIEQKGLDVLPIDIVEALDYAQVYIEQDGPKLKVTLPKCKWWERLQDEIKIAILNAGWGWHDLYDEEVLAVRAASKLYVQPEKLRAWLGKAPQDHQVILSKFRILDLLLKRRADWRKECLKEGTYGKDGEAEPGLMGNLFGFMSPSSGGQHMMMAPSSGKVVAPEKIMVGISPSSGNKGSIPLQMVDEVGKAVDFEPITIWGGQSTQDIGWNVEDLEAERLLLSKDCIQDEVDDWINVQRIREYAISNEIVQVELKLAKLFTPPLPWFLSECLFECITQSRMPKDLKYKSLIQHPPFCQKFLRYFKRRQKLLLRLWSDQQSTKLFGEMMKLAGDHFDGPDYFKRFIENISNSAYWANFVKLITETLLSHAEVCEQMRMKTTDAESREYLASIIKLKNAFLKSFGTLTARDVNMVSLDRLRAFLINVAMKDPALFGELMLIIGTTRPEFCGNIIEMNHYMKLNDELFEIVADTAAGCELIARFFCLDENHQIIGPLLQGTILQESEEGRELYNLYKYENDAATRMAREAIITLEKTLEPYIKITAVRISRLTELINSFCSYLNTVFESIDKVQKCPAKHRVVNKTTKGTTMRPSHGANLMSSYDYSSSHDSHSNQIRPTMIPACSAGPGSRGSDSFCQNGISLSDITESSIHSRRSGRVKREKAQLTADDVSSIQTYDNLSGINIPNPSGIPGDDDDDISSSVLDSREIVESDNFSEIEPLKSPIKPAAPKIEEKKEVSEPPKVPPKKSPSNVPQKAPPAKTTTPAKVAPKPAPVTEAEEYSEVPTNKDDVNNEIDDAVQKKNVISLKKEHPPHIKKKLKVKIADHEIARREGEKVKPILEEIGALFRKTTDLIENMTYLNSVDYSLLCKIGANAPKQILLGELQGPTSYSVKQILAMRDMFAKISKASKIYTDIPVHFVNKVFVCKELQNLSIEEIFQNDEMTIFEVLGQTLDDLAESIDEDEISGKWWMRVFKNINESVDSNTSQADKVKHVVQHLIMGSVLERYRKVPDNNLIAREMIIRLENMTKLSWGVEIEIENFKKYLAQTDAQMRRDFLAGASKSTETEMTDMVQKPELHKLKTKIQDVFNNATKDNSPLMVNLPVRAKVVTEELIRKLVASANLLTVEGDAEEEFWETEFKKTVVRKAPLPSCRPISVFKQMKRKAIRLYKNPQKAIAKKAAKALRKLRNAEKKKEKNMVPWPSSAGASKRNNGDGDKISNALQSRMTQLMDPPMFPSIFGTIIIQGMLVMAVGLLAYAPLMQLTDDQLPFTDGIIVICISIAIFFGIEWMFAVPLSKRFSKQLPAFRRKFNYQLL